MRRLFFLLLVVGLGGICSLRAEGNVQSAQTRLKQGGFYFGDATGVYDSETAAAVTRFQIRNGLPINGKLDAATAKALGVSGGKSETAAAPASGTWRRLRNGDMQFLKQLNSGAIPPPGAQAQASPRSSAPRKVAPSSRAKPARANDGDIVSGRERLRDYVGAFVLAGLDPQEGAELEFFADRVDYFGERNVGRAKIRRDLVRYDRQWPQRRFWLAGELRVDPASDGKLRVTFPLRYELRNGSKRASGEVSKTLTLRRSGTENFEIVAVNERKAGR